MIRATKLFLFLLLATLSSQTNNHIKNQSYRNQIKRIRKKNKIKRRKIGRDSLHLALHLVLKRLIEGIKARRNQFPSKFMTVKKNRGCSMYSEIKLIKGTKT